MLSFLFKRSVSWVRPLRAGLLVCLGALGLPASTSAAVILTIDISNPAAVRIEATGAHAQNDDIDSTYMLQGVLLLGVFSSNPGWNVPDYLDDSDLYSPGGTFAYSDLYYDGVDLNITGTNLSTQDFSTTEPAFEGYAIVDFSAVAHLLIPGTTGDILAGDMWDSTVVIGQYLIIPEPGTSLLALASVGLLLGRRRR
jgi:hypothetical protein